jgi:hypothetical protein
VYDDGIFVPGNRLNYVGKGEEGGRRKVEGIRNWGSGIRRVNRKDE